MNNYIIYIYIIVYNVWNRWFVCSVVRTIQSCAWPCPSKNSPVLPNPKLKGLQKKGRAKQSLLSRDIDSGFLWSQYHPILSNIIQHPSNIIQHHPTSSTIIIYHPILSYLIQCPFLLYGWPATKQCSTSWSWSAACLGFWGDEFKASLKERPLALRPWLVVVVHNYLG